MHDTPVVKHGDPNNVMKTALVVPQTDTPQEFLAPHGKASAVVTVDPTNEQAARVLDQIMATKLFCADITDGLLVGALTASPGTCSDKDGTPEVNLQCSFVGRIRFDLINYSMLPMTGETCARGKEDHIVKVRTQSLFVDGLASVFPNPYLAHQA